MEKGNKHRFVEKRKKEKKVNCQKEKRKRRERVRKGEIKKEQKCDQKGEKNIIKKII